MKHAHTIGCQASGGREGCAGVPRGSLAECTSVDVPFIFGKNLKVFFKILKNKHWKIYEKKDSFQKRCFKKGSEGEKNVVEMRRH